MPKRLIFDSSVCRGMRSFTAAPEGPGIRPCDSARAASIISTSRSAKAEGPSGKRKEPADVERSQLSATTNVLVRHRITARSTTFCSSRMFPGQSYNSNSSSVLSSICLMFLPAFLAYRSRKSWLYGSKKFVRRPKGARINVWPVDFGGLGRSLAAIRQTDVLKKYCSLIHGQPVLEATLHLNRSYALVAAEVKHVRCNIFQAGFDFAGGGN